jgi:hypothetical protein
MYDVLRRSRGLLAAAAPLHQLDQQAGPSLLTLYEVIDELPGHFLGEEQHSSETRQPATRQWSVNIRSATQSYTLHSYPVVKSNETILIGIKRPFSNHFGRQ